MVVGGSRCGIRDTPWGLFSDPKPAIFIISSSFLKGFQTPKTVVKSGGVNRTNSRNIGKVGLFCQFELFPVFYIFLVSTPKDKHPREVEKWPELVFLPLIMMRIEDKKLLNVDLTAVAGENCSPPTVPMTMKKRSRDLHILEVRNKGGTT